MPDGRVLEVLRNRPGWQEAVAELRVLWGGAGGAAQQRAEQYGMVYEGRRGAMVVDVVASRQRKYQSRVLPLVARWEEHVEDSTLRQLAARPDSAMLGLRSGEAETMSTVACRLLRFADEHGLSEDEACRAWATSVDALEHAYLLDPYVGSVRGIGLALFSYLRMRCGADALKPDIRVQKALNTLGFNVPNNPDAILVIAKGAAAEIGTGPLVLDQLLWGRQVLEP